MTYNNIEIKQRISNKKFKAVDIKHKDRLSVEDIQDIPIEKVYEWVKTSQWKQADFKKWLKGIRVL